jgi:hypothetical protein
MGLKEMSDEQVAELTLELQSRLVRAIGGDRMVARTDRAPLAVNVALVLASLTASLVAFSAYDDKSAAALLDSIGAAREVKMRDIVEQFGYGTIKMRGAGRKD